MVIAQFSFFFAVLFWLAQHGASSVHVWFSLRFLAGKNAKKNIVILNFQSHVSPQTTSLKQSIRCSSDSSLYKQVFLNEK